MINMEVSSKFFVIRTTGGQEKNVTNFIENRVKNKGMGVYSIVALDNLKGYILVEAENAQTAYESAAGFKHVKSQVPGMIKSEDVVKMLVTKSIISELSENDIVEIITGPFKGMKARVQRIDKIKSEITIVLLDVSYQLPVTIDANYVKIVEKAKG
ncbi:Transcription termination/antitermination protein NusG [archaeon HR06]|nr:Transcription termination/antitermination protein NusG [archaeon HR06]